MVDKEHDDFNWKLIFNWSILVVLGSWWWYNVLTKGFLVTILWSVVVMALYGLWVTMGDLRK